QVALEQSRDLRTHRVQDGDRAGLAAVSGQRLDPQGGMQEIEGGEMAEQGDAFGRILAGERAAAEQVAIAVPIQVAGEPLPKQLQHAPVAVLTVDAGASYFHALVDEILRKGGEIEFL